MPNRYILFVFLLTTNALTIRPTNAQTNRNETVKIHRTYQNADSLYLVNKNQAALDTLLEVLPQLENCDDTLQSKILGLFGYLHRQIGSDTVSFQNFLKNVQGEKLKKYLQSVDVLSNYFLKRKNYQKALNYAQKLILFSQQANDKYQEANGYFVTGKVFKVTGNLEKSKAYLYKAMRLYKGQNINQKTIQTLSLIGEIYNLENEKDSAISYFRQTIKLARTEESPLIRSIAYHRIGLVMLENKNYSEGFRYMNNALDLAEKYNSAGISQIYFDMGLYKLKTGEKHKALEYLLTAKETANKSGNLSIELKAIREAANIYLNLKDYKKASVYYEKSLRLNDQLQKQVNIKATSQMEARYNLLQKEQQIELLDRDKKIREIKLKHQNIQSRFMLLGLFFLIILIGIMTYHILMRKKQNKVLEEQNQQINDQNEELNQINRQLSESEEKLILALGTKDRLFAIIGHDLKSPLMNLKNLLFILKNNPGQLASEKITEHAKEIDVALTSLLELLNNLLNWSLTENNIIKYKPEDCNLTDLIESTTKLFKGQLRTKKIKLNTDIPENVILKTDKNMFDFIARNIISNAIKFSNPESTIDLKIIESPGHIEFSVKDYGVGMSDVETSNLYSIDAQKIKEGTYKEKGTGLGLKVSYDFIKQMGGKIYVNSSTGKGTIVTVVLTK